MRLRSVMLLAALGLLSTALAGCGLGPVDVAGEATPEGVAQPGPTGLAGLPQPSVLLGRIATAGAVVRLTGAQHDPAVPPQHVFANGALLELDPAYPAGATGHDGLALALYRFNTVGYTGSADLRCGWASPPEPATTWLGLGLVGTDSWVWRKLPADNRLPVSGGFAPYTTLGGEMLAVLAVTGTANPCGLAYIRLGNEPPQVELLATPTSGALPLAADFDATANSDADGSISSIELDRGDGAGFAVMLGGVANHSYTVQGTYSATARVTDTEGASATASVQIDAGVSTNQPPIAVLTVDPSPALLGDRVTLAAAASSDPDGTVVRYAYDPEGDGTFLDDRFDPDGEPSHEHIYTAPGTYHPTVRVTDDDGATATASQTLLANYGTLVKLTMSTPVGSGEYCDIGVAGGKLCVAYQQNGQVGFIRAHTPASDTFFPPALLGGVDTGLSLADLNGTPGIVYQVGMSLMFRRANAADGSSWAAPVLVMTHPDAAGVYPSLAMVNGKPAAVGSDSLDFSCWFSRANDSLGTSWNVRQPVSAPGQGAVCGGLLALADGTPCVALTRPVNAVSFRLQFCRAEDNAGQDWPLPFDLSTLNCAPLQGSGLQLIAGRPAIVFVDKTNNKVRFQRAKDATGSEWNSPLSVVSITQFNGVVSLTVINGLPAIAFVDQTSGLRLSIAKTSVAASWNNPVAVDSSATGAEYVSLTEFNSRPALAFSDGTSLQLAFWE